MGRAVLIYNPRSGRWASERRIDGLLSVLRGVGIEAEPRPTAGPGDATLLARAAIGEGAELVLAYGGDGTLREAAGGLLGSEVPLGFLPGGTANVMRLELGLPGDALAAARHLDSTRPRPFDVGLCAGQAFLMQASGGLDAVILGSMGAVGKRLLGTLAVAPAGFVRWLDYGYPELTVEAAGERITGTLFVAANIGRYGGDWRLLDARSDDGLLDLLIFRGRGRGPSLAFARDLFLGRARHLRRPDVVVKRVTHASVLAPPELLLQVDGDVLRERPPVAIELARGRVRLLSLRPAASC